jgi:hypothetical protein
MTLLLVIAQWAVVPIETVDMTGGWPSLALDSRDFPRIAYWGETGWDLKYAWWNGATWQVQIVDTTGWCGDMASLALDSQDRPHISYWEGTIPTDVYDLKYAWWDGSAWQIERVDTAGYVGTWGCLALDSQDRPCISYFDYGAGTDYKLKYARWDGSAWQLSMVDTTDSIGGYGTSLALDSQDRPHISYYYGGDLRYAYWNGLGWQIQKVDTAGYVGFYPSIALDSLDRPHISYCWNWGGLWEGLKYAWWDGSAWQIEMVDTIGEVGEFSSLALDKEDRPCISYFDYTNGRLKYAWWDGSSWQAEVVDAVGVQSGYRGTPRSLQIGSDDCPRIAFHREVVEDLFYAYKGCAPLAIEEESGNAFEFRTMGRGLYLSLPGEVWVSLSLYDASGRLVQNLWDGLLNAGGHSFVPGVRERGVYIAVLRHPGGTQTVKVVR